MNNRGRIYNVTSSNWCKKCKHVTLLVSLSLHKSILYTKTYYATLMGQLKQNVTT